MSEEAFAYSATAEMLRALPVEDALKGSVKAECLSYSAVFFERAKGTDTSGDNEAARAWRLLGNLCQAALQAREPNEPFRPVWEDADGRTFVPSDMDEESAAAVRQSGFIVKDAELRSRLLDATWDRLRDPGAAREAVRSYVEAADGLFDPEHWTAYAVRMERAARLARQLRDSDLVDGVLKAIEDRVVRLDGSDPLYLSCRLMTILHEFDYGDPASMRGIAAKGARLAESKGDFERARTWHDLGGRWCRRTGDDEGEKAARIEVAASLYRQAEQQSQPGQELVTAHLLEKAHEAYRNIPGMRSKAEKIYAQLRECQQRSGQYMGRSTTEIPYASELIGDARDWVAGKSRQGALLTLATVVQVTDFKEAAKNARERMTKYPLQGLFEGVTMDHSDRVVGRTKGAFTTDENELEQALWDRVVREVVPGYQVDVKTGIVPAMNQLNFEHSLRLEDMVDLVVDNPFVPPGHEELFARGFFGGIPVELRRKPVDSRSAT